LHKFAEFGTFKLLLRYYVFIVKWRLFVVLEFKHVDFQYLISTVYIGAVHHSKTRIPSGIWSRLYGCPSRAESVSCNTAIKWHAHIFKWHSAEWPRASTADCDWSAIGPPTQDFFCHGQKRDYLSCVSQRARGATKKLSHNNQEIRLFIETEMTAIRHT